MRRAKKELFTLWIVPPQPLFDELKERIKYLGKKYNAPIFDPHITVIGNVDDSLENVIKGSRQVVKNLGKNLHLDTGEVTFSSTFYQSVVLSVLPSSKLMNLAMTAQSVFSREHTPYWPHISLMYGGDMETRSIITSTLPAIYRSFDINELLIVPTSREIEKWEAVERIPFKG